MSLNVSAGLLATISLETLRAAAVGVVRLALAVGAAAALAFGALSVALSPVAAAAVGVVVYGAMMMSLRSFGLTEAWTYVRGLHH